MASALGGGACGGLREQGLGGNEIADSGAVTVVAALASGHAAG